MAFALLIIGAVLLITAVKGTTSQLFTLLQGDFSGQRNYIYWGLAILAVGAIGYIPKAKPFSIALIILLILAMIRNQGSNVFQEFTSAIGTTQGAATPNANVTQVQTSTGTVTATLGTPITGSLPGGIIPSPGMSTISSPDGTVLSIPNASGSSTITSGDGTVLTLPTI